MTAHARAPAGAGSGLLSIEEWDAIGETEERFELVEGILVEMAPPTSGHNLSAHNLWALLKAALSRPEWVVLGEQGVRVKLTFPPTVRVPDVLVVRRSAYRRDLSDYQNADLLLVAEFVSPSSTAVDWVYKRREYEKAGIPHYWIFDVRDKTRMPKATILKLVDGTYQEQQAGPDDKGLVNIVEPVPLRFLWADLLE